MDFLGVADLVEAECAAELSEHQGKDLILSGFVRLGRPRRGDACSGGFPGGFGGGEAGEVDGAGEAV